MKKLVFFLFVLCLVLFSCGKKEDSKANKPGIFCELDGRSWSGDTISYVQKTGEFILIVAPKGNVMSGPFEGLSIYIKSDLKTGDFMFTEENDQTHADFSSNVTKTDKKSDNDYDAFHSKDGKISIVKFDDSHVEGTFNCTLVTSDEPKKALKLTNGKFNLKILK